MPNKSARAIELTTAREMASVNNPLRLLAMRAPREPSDYALPCGSLRQTANQEFADETFARSKV